MKMYDEPKQPSVYKTAVGTMEKWHSGKSKYVTSVATGEVSKARV